MFLISFELMTYLNLKYSLMYSFYMSLLIPNLNSNIRIIFQTIGTQIESKLSNHYQPLLEHIPNQPKTFLIVLKASSSSTDKYFFIFYDNSLLRFIQKFKNVIICGTTCQLGRKVKKSRWRYYCNE